MRVNFDDNYGDDDYNDERWHWWWWQWEWKQSVTTTSPRLLHIVLFTSHPHSFLTLRHRVVRMKSYLSITTDLNLLTVIPQVYQMMSLLEWNTSSKDEGKWNALFFACLIIVTLAALDRTCRCAVHCSSPFIALHCFLEWVKWTQSTGSV